MVTIVSSVTLQNVLTIVGLVGMVVVKGLMDVSFYTQFFVGDHLTTGSVMTKAVPWLI